MDYFYLVGGFIILLYSGNFLVKGGVALANHYKISTLVVGVTVISFGTSAPELFVSIQAAVTAHPDIAVGNVIGSNIANIALVLALTAMILPIPIKSNSVKIDWPIMMLSAILLYVFFMNGKLQFYEGLLFAIMLTAFLVWSIHKSRIEQLLLKEETPPPKFSKPVALVLILVSSVGLAFGSNWLVKGASAIAMNFGVSEKIISITIIAFGTSIPELATSMIAAIKSETDISIGNIIGSNIFNTFGILGITAIINPISIEFKNYNSDFIWMIGIFILLLLMILPLKGGKLKRWKGLIMFMVYALYIYFLITGKTFSL